MSKLDFSGAPYTDDFDPLKGFQKILFRPGRAVQARELNQIQSMFGNQLSSLANHIFKNGSKVSNGRTALAAKSYVRLLNDPVVSTYPAGTRLVGATSGIQATLVVGVDPENGDPSTLYVVYTSSAIDGTTSTFIPGEKINILDENGFTVDEVEVRCPTCPGSGLSDTVAPVGRGQMFSIDEGIFYFEGMFIETPPQQIIVTKYLTYDTDGNITNFVPCKIGLDFIQSVVTYNEDSSLLDPALGYPNSTAPGADRYRTELRLVKREYNVEDGENFISLARLGEGLRIEFMKMDSDYADIMDTIAKRTYETNGDYTIRPFRVSFLNSKKKTASDPLGWSVNGSDDDLIAVVTPSVAYVKGYRVETMADTPVAFRKARDTKKMDSFVKHFDGRTYILGKPASNVSWPNLATDSGTMGGTVVTLYDGVATSGGIAGQAIGTFRVTDMQYVSGDVAANTAIFKYYIYDLKLLPGFKLSQAQGYAVSNTGFYTNVVKDATTNQVEIYNNNRQALIYRLDRNDVKSLRSIADANNGSINVVVRRKLTGVADGSGSVTFTTSSNEYFDNAGPSLVGWYTASGVTRSFDASAAANLNPTSLTLNIGSAAAGASVTVIADILRTNQTEKQKLLTKLTINTVIAPGENIGDKVMLGKADAFRLNSVKVFVDGTPTDPVADVTSEYAIHTGITDTAYGESWIQRVKAPATPISPTMRLAISFDYYEHSGNQGYFTIDSYAAALNAPDSGVTYDSLPTYVSMAGDSYPVASSIDFRPVVIGSDPVSVLLPANDSTMTFDIEYYLSRADLLQINKDGVIYVKEGEPSETPRIPKTDDNAMALYQIWLTPYTYSLKDISTKFIENRRYTMRDIGAIENRLTNVETIVSLNLLEKSAADMSIKDSNGLDRYKNGFIADNFQDFQAADLQSKEWRAGTDRSQRQLRPSFKASNKKLKFNLAKSIGVALRGNVATLPFDNVMYIEQPYATKHLSVNPYLQYNQKGSLVLSPNNDVWSDDTRLPEIVVDIDAGVDAIKQIADAAGVTGTDWGSWVDQNRTILGSSSTSNTQVNGRTTTTTNTTTTTSSVTAARTGTAKTVESRTDTYKIDDVVKDVSLITYIRARKIEFYATKLKPNTRIYAFFDGTKVSEFCRDIGFQLNASNAGQASQLVEYGSPMITDANGEFRGEFNIPGGRFFVGEKQFVLTDDPNMSGDPDLETTTAKCVYFAGGLDVTKQDVSLNVITPNFTTEQVTETSQRTETTVNRDTTVVNNPAPASDTGRCNQGSTQMISRLACECARGRLAGLCGDPVAQAFIVDQEIFASGLDVYFKQVDLFSDRIFVELRDMVNGYPGVTRLAQKFYTPDQIAPFISDDSSKPFHVDFDAPVFLQAGVQYCFVVGGASPNTRIWVSRLGGEVVNMPGKIVELPATSEVSFRSLNGTTWNAEQYEQIKYKLYRANFKSQQMTLVFENEHDPDAGGYATDENPFQTQTGSTRIRVYQKNHGFTPGDRVSFALFDTNAFRVRYSDFVPQIGQTMHTPTGSGVIDDIKSTSVSNEYMVTVKNMSGVMTASQTYVCDAMTKTARDFWLASSMDSKKPESYTLNQCVGTVLENSYGNKYVNGLIAGIPVGEFNTEYTSGSLGLTVIDVDSIDTYIINVQTPATITGRVGGTGIRVYNGNEKYDVFNVSGAYLPYRATESWTMTGIAHGEAGSVFESQDYNVLAPIAFVPQEDKFSGQPLKIASKNNEQIKLGAGNKSATVTVAFSAANSWTSPIINLDSFSMTTINNRCEWRDKAKLEAIPTGEPTWVDERDPINGTETYKYVTRSVNLANAANDISIFVDVYKDLNADFDIYVKRLPVYETAAIDTLPWIKVNNIVKSRSSVDLTDFIEYNIVASRDILKETVNGVVIPGWLDDAGAPTPFTSFQVKLVGRSKNSAKPPLFRALRIIAVT